MTAESELKRIVYKNGSYWVREESDGTFGVYRIGVTHSTSDSSYESSALAIARCNYLARIENA